MNLSQKLPSGKVLVLDGAMGTELMRRGLELPLPVWSADANVTHPELVEAIHRDYLTAGADILTTNTFRTTPRTYRKAGYSDRKAKSRAKTSLMTAVKLARTAGESGHRVAGSIAPLEDCYSPELFPGSEQALAEFGELGEWFMESGVDILLIETMGHPDEIRAALTATAETGIPRWVSFILKDSHRLLGGHSLIEAVALVENPGVEAILLNCNSMVVTQGGIKTLLKHWQGSWGVYPNLGLSAPEPDGRFQALVPLSNFREAVRDYLHTGASVVGTCCGSTPDHTRILREMVDSL